MRFIKITFAIANTALVTIGTNSLISTGTSRERASEDLDITMKCIFGPVIR